MNTIDKFEIKNLLNGTNKDPHSILGIHIEEDKVKSNEETAFEIFGVEV